MHFEYLLTTTLLCTTGVRWWCLQGREHEFHEVVLEAEREEVGNGIQGAEESEVLEHCGDDMPIEILSEDSSSDDGMQQAKMITSLHIYLVAT